MATGEVLVVRAALDGGGWAVIEDEEGIVVIVDQPVMPRVVVAGEPDRVGPLVSDVPPPRRSATGDVPRGTPKTS